MPIHIHFLIAVLMFLSVPVLSQLDQLIYAGFKDIGPNNLTLKGTAGIDKNGIITLTNETNILTPYVVGQAFYSQSFQLKNSTTGKAFSFSSSFALAFVHKYSRFGDYIISFSIVTSKDLPNHAGYSSNHGFHVEINTVRDYERSDNHVIIDTVPYYHSTLQELNFRSGKPFLVWVDYDSSHNLLSVTLSLTSIKPKKPNLSFHMDLSPILHDTMYVGFYASTSPPDSSYYILGWSFKINGPAQFIDLTSLPQLPQPKKKQTSLIIGVSVTASVIALGFVTFGIYIFRKIMNADVIETWELEIGPHRYSYQELKKATKGFKEKELLGQGGFGKVYKGTLPKSNIQVAVKRVSHESKQGLREFVSEIASTGRLRHKNLVPLLGWCRRRGDLLLVYDFMANGSLDKYLFKDSKCVLSWEQRFKILKGVASGLFFLHEGYEQVVLHRDVKSSNVLLDFEFNGRLADFGLSRLHKHGANPGTTTVAGTFGYLAPELPRTGKPSTSSDVFAFGALLLEVACGRRPIEPKASQEELLLVDWAWERYKEGRIVEVVDPKLNGSFDENEVMMVLKLGLICSNDVPTIRPSMRQVVRILDGEVELPNELRQPRDIDSQLGFDEFLYCLETSSFDKTSSSSYLGNRDMNTRFVSSAKW